MLKVTKHLSFLDFSSVLDCVCEQYNTLCVTHCEFVFSLVIS